jgi:DNA-binding XRE family transcriptional regulator
MTRLLEKSFADSLRATDSRNHGPHFFARHMSRTPKKAVVHRDPALENLLMRVAENVRTYRTTAGLTQAQLATLAGISRPVISALECGTTDARVTTLNYIAQALHIDVTNLVG